jgi:hypothetical protein
MTSYFPDCEIMCDSSYMVPQARGTVPLSLNRTWVAGQLNCKTETHNPKTISMTKLAEEHIGLAHQMQDDSRLLQCHFQPEHQVIS